MKVSLCGEADCPTPYEFCEACIRADERERFRESMELAEAEVRSHKDRWADLRAKVEAIGTYSTFGPDGSLDGADVILRADVLALLDTTTEKEVTDE